MQIYLNNIVNRLKNFSDSLNRKEILIDQPWVLITGDAGNQKYIFKRNGEVIYTIEGSAHIGKWEYLHTARALLIDKGQEKILLKETFVDPGVIILHLDGHIQDKIVLMNERISPDLNLERYIDTLYTKHLNIKRLRLKGGNFLEYSYQNDFSIYGIPLILDGKTAPDNSYELEDNRIVIVNNGIVEQVLAWFAYDFAEEKVFIRHSVITGSLPKVGNQVYGQKSGNSISGTYRIQLFHKLHVNNGRITRITIF